MIPLAAAVGEVGKTLQIIGDDHFRSSHRGRI
jgi:hypothetical protein